MEKEKPLQQIVLEQLIDHLQKKETRHRPYTFHKN